MRQWDICQVTTIGKGCWAMLKESLRNTIRWAVQQATGTSRSYDQIAAQSAIT